MNEMIIIVAGLFLMYYMDIKYILIILVALYIYRDYDNIKEKINVSLKIDKKHEIEYNSNIERLLNKFKRYSKKYKKQYDLGLYYWKKFIKMIKILENESLHNFNHYFDRAFDYLKQSVNSFQSISISIKERELIHGIKFGDYTNAKNTKNVSILSKELYQEGYLLLYNLSLELNKRWLKNPNINNKQIILDHPLEYDKNISSYDFYI
tara:strand:+ start:823 stop:1446 length:624 start_codon:yes stop_codon:yes gene_type:complete